MLRTALLSLIAVLVALIPGSALAEDEDNRDNGDVTIRIDGDFHLAQGEIVGTAIVIHGDATIDGFVRDALVVVDGAATVNGTVGESITIISGDLALGPRARVNDVLLIRSDLARDPGATVTGDITRRSRILFPGAAVVFGILAWVGITVMMLLAGLLFAAVGGGQLTRAAQAMTASPGQTILGAVVVVVGIPMAAVAAIITLLGLVAGLAMLFFLLPALLFLGYVVAGAFLGGLLTRGLGRQGGTSHPYLEVVAGLALLQVAMLIPGFGALAGGLLSLWGAGGLAYLAWLAFRPPAPAPVPPPAAAS